MRIHLSRTEFRIGDELISTIIMLKDRLTRHLRRHPEIDNIFAIVILHDKIAAEIIGCQEYLGESHSKAMFSFEDWISKKSSGRKASQVFSTRYTKGESSLFLAYRFENRFDEMFYDVWNAPVSRVVKMGQNVYDVIFKLGQACGYFCPDCGVPLHHLHKLGCRYEQCSNCYGLLASCLCGMEEELLLGWNATEVGAIPGDDIRIPYGGESYTMEVLKMFIGDLRKSA